MSERSTSSRHPDSFIQAWLSENPERAVKIAHAALFGMFVDNDDSGEPFLNPNNIPDVNDLFAELAPVVDSSSFADFIPVIEM